VVIAGTCLEPAKPPLDPDRREFDEESAEIDHRAAIVGLPARGAAAVTRITPASRPRIALAAAGVTEYRHARGEGAATAA